jgi:hypothetical protein
MQVKKLSNLFFIFSILLSEISLAQEPVPQKAPVDSVIKIDIKTDPSTSIKDSSTKKVKVFNPHTAAIRSAIIPGWGQIYNKKYWKLPIVYGALGATAGVFFYNLHTYKDLKFAYAAKYKTTLNPPDSSDYFKMNQKYIPYSLESLRFNRDQFRQGIDYSVLVFMLFWGLNVVDASVDAHLKGFDVGPDLSLKIKPGYSPMAGTKGVSLVFTIGKKIPSKNYSR